MSKKELLKRIYEMIDYIVNGKVVRDNRVFYGHPNFYLKHTKEEFKTTLNSIIDDKQSYDEYDLYYYVNYMFKYMLNEYDSHTKLSFINKPRIPLKIRYINSELYIVDCNEDMKEFIGSKLLKINGIDIDLVISDLDKIICYASNNYFKVLLEDNIININVLKSLPCIGRAKDIKFETDKGEISFTPNNIKRLVDKSTKPNYNVEQFDEIAVITYNHCKNEQLMINMIEKLKRLTDVDKYIVDLRGNSGGNSAINRHLVNFLKGKKIITLCDERTFSSARMCLLDLKNAGSKIIGSEPGTPISCFGNNIIEKKYTDLNLILKGSATYWYYDDNLVCHGIDKTNFEEELRSNPNLLKLVYAPIDEEVELTIDDYINSYDSVLDYAIKSFNKKNKFNI